MLLVLVIVVIIILLSLSILANVSHNIFQCLTCSYKLHNVFETNKYCNVNTTKIRDWSYAVQF